MNIEQASALSDDELQIKVAELVGLPHIHRGNRTYYHGFIGAVNPLPDYVNDLNAMHEVICALPSELNHGAEFERYQHCLKKLLFPRGIGFGWLGKMLKTTAKQRAIAFVVARTNQGE